MKKNMFRHLVLLLLALSPFVGWAQQKNYNGQHVSIKQATGDSIQYDISKSSRFKPVIKNGTVEWSFLNWEEKEGFAVKNVESIDFRSFKYDEKEVRKALIEFYHEMDGDNWVRKDNWCSDKPIWEWYGINGCLDKEGDKYPWVKELWFNCAPNSNSAPVKFPESIMRMGPIQNLAIPLSNIEGELPAFLGKIYSLQSIVLSGNKFSGQFPEGLEKLPDLFSFIIENNQIEGPLPEDFILKCMNNPNMPGNNFNIANNNFTGKIPKSIQNHSRFAEFWPGIVLQNQPMDVSDLVIPAPVFTTKGIKGNTIDLGKQYKKNKYTLLYLWGTWCPYSMAFNQMLIPAYKTYKDKGLEIIGFHTWEGSDGLAEFLKDNDIPWDNVLYDDWNWNSDGTTNDKGAIFSWSAVPQTFLVDQNGTIVFNSYLDDKGNNVMTTGYYPKLLEYLEDKLGPIEYDLYTSTDYSRDGEWTTLQTASVGNGIDLVFVGEGFTDVTLGNGTFDQRMNEALEQFFAYEPYKSLRNRFNVYAVRTVSPNEEFYASNAVHAIDEDISKALEYASNVPDLIPDRPMHVVVIYNNNSGGRSYCTMMEDDSFVCFSMDGVSTVLNHEAGGHGFGKLLDEYVETVKEGDWTNMPEETKTMMDNMWTTLGWGANVDWRCNPAEVKWAKFISDERYADENIGLYEGSYLYQYGAYRPTENSMMRHNDIGFNAPSREEIYKRVMKESEGDGWTYDYETFVAFDANSHLQSLNTAKTRLKMKAKKIEEKNEQQVQRTAPPVFLKGTWRDVLKKNKK